MNGKSSRDKVIVASSLAAPLLALIVMLVILAPFSSSSSHQGPSLAQRISQPLNRQAIVRIASRRLLPRVFWLGPGSPDLELRTDLKRQFRLIQLAYISPAAQRAINVGVPDYRYLVVTNVFADQAKLSILKHLSSREVHHPGFTVYLPPKRYLDRRELFAVTNDQQWVGVIATKGPATMPAFLALAKQVRLIRVSSNG